MIYRVRLGERKFLYSSSPMWKERKYQATYKGYENYPCVDRVNVSDMVFLHIRELIELEYEIILSTDVQAQYDEFWARIPLEIKK